MRTVTLLSMAGLLLFAVGCQSMAKEQRRFEVVADVFGSELDRSHRDAKLAEEKTRSAVSAAAVAIHDTALRIEHDIADLRAELDAMTMSSKNEALDPEDWERTKAKLKLLRKEIVRVRRESSKVRLDAELGMLYDTALGDAIEALGE